MRNKKTLLIEQLDQKLQPFQETVTILVPEKGWINAIRTTLNMTMVCWRLLLFTGCLLRLFGCFSSFRVGQDQQKRLNKSR